MDRQPYCLKTGAGLGDRWICNANTGKPLVRLDRNQNGDYIFIFPGHNAITVNNILDIVNQLTKIRETV